MGLACSGTEYQALVYVLAESPPLEVFDKSLLYFCFSKVDVGLWLFTLLIYLPYPTGNGSNTYKPFGSKARDKIIYLIHFNTDHKPFCDLGFPSLHNYVARYTLDYIFVINLVTHFGMGEKNNLAIYIIRL